MCRVPITACSLFTRLLIAFISGSEAHYHEKLKKYQELHNYTKTTIYITEKTITTTRLWANVQRDGCPAEHRWRPLFNAAKFG